MIILDTNVISELMRPTPNARVVGWIDAQEQSRLYLTSITLAETLYGIERMPPGGRQRELSAYVGKMLQRRFRFRVLGFDEESAKG